MLNLRRIAGVLRLAFKRGGFVETLNVVMRGFYVRFRRPMPTLSHAAYNGVSVGIDRKALDRFVPSKWLADDTRDIPTYESGLVAALRQYVRSGDRVVIVGGGWGVTTVWAARATGSRGSITTFEMSTASVDRVRWTVENARCGDIVRTVHSRVERVAENGVANDPLSTRPEDLPECDVLELDCEGAELGILASLLIRPRLILVESHGIYGSSSQAVRDTLLGMGYSIVSQQVAESRSPTRCAGIDVMVLVAVRD